MAVEALRSDQNNAAELGAVGLAAGRSSKRPLVLELGLWALLLVVPVSGSSVGRGEIGSPLAVELVAKLALLLVVGGVFVLYGSGRWPASTAWRVLVTLAGFFVLTAPFAVSPASALIDAALLVGATLLAGLLAVEVGMLRLLRSLAGSVTLLVVGSFAVERWFERSTQNVLDGGGLQGFDRVAGLFSDPNTMGQAAAVGVLASVLLLLHARRVGGAAVCGVVCLIGLASTQSRTASIGLAAALVVGVLRTRRARVAGMLAAVLLVGFVLWLPGAGSFGAESLTRSGDAQEVATLTGRTRVWKSVVEVVPERPIIGHGAGSSPEVVSELVRDGRISWPALHAHNAVLQVLLTGGVTGVVLLVAAFGTWFLKRRTERRLNGFVWLVIVGTVTEVLVMRTPSMYWLVLAAVFAVGGGVSTGVARSR